MKNRLTQHTIITASLLLASHSLVVQADIEFIQMVGVTFNEKTARKIERKNLYKARDEIKWHELHGSINGRYVYLMVKKTGVKDIDGYLFDDKGNKQYVYGEWLENRLIVYDRSNNLLQVILQKK